MYKINNKIVKLLEPKEFGLSPRTVIGEFAENKFALIKDRKSRIIMKDGRQIYEQIETIKKAYEKCRNRHCNQCTNLWKNHKIFY